MSFLNTRPITLLERSLDAASLRNKVVSNNIANIDTPGFKRSDVSFEQTLQEVLSGQSLSGRTTDPRHIAIGNISVGSVQPTTYTDRSTSLRLDGNNVDVDSEMVRLVTNQIQFHALTTQINHQFGLLKYAISEGKR